MRATVTVAVTFDVEVDDVAEERFDEAMADAIGHEFEHGVYSAQWVLEAWSPTP